MPKHKAVTIAGCFTSISITNGHNIMLLLLGNIQVNKEPDGSEIIPELLANQAGRFTLIQLRMANALT